jgi:hypothetical protein
MKCVAIAGKIGFKAKEALVVKQGEELNSIQVGLAFFSVAMQYAETDFKELLASIAEMSVEEFEQQPFDFPITILEHLAETEDLKSFLERVQTLAKKVFGK